MQTSGSRRPGRSDSQPAARLAVIIALVHARVTLAISPGI